jgi:YD repeat-containing protein
MVRSFEYDNDGYVTGVLDAVGNRTQLVRSADHLLREIVSPYGQSTLLGYDSLGRLTSVTDPDGLGSSLTYKDTTDLMASFTNRRGITSSYQWDAGGLLLRDSDAAGFVELDATSSDTIVKRDADGRVTKYVSRLTEDATVREFTAPDGTVQTTTQRSDGVSTTQLADGTLITESQQSDSNVVGASIPLERVVKLPSGLTSSSTYARTVATDGTITTTRTTNGNVWTQRYVPSTRTSTQTTPEGRSVATVLDSLGRPVAISSAGRATLQLQYDARGRPFKTILGSSPSRQTTVTFDALGRGETLESTDASTVSFARDALGRVTSSSAGTSVIEYGLDPGGNLTSVTTPSASLHTQAYTRRGMLASYTAPGAAPASAVSYAYTAMGELASLSLANGHALELVRDEKKRVAYRV